VTIFVGPEGDFTPAEIALAKSHGCQPVTLGPIILRTETAAIYCLSVLAHELFSQPQA
jgi:16S rRNA (uracil1498-N3)-methyltransferase